MVKINPTKTHEIKIWARKLYISQNLKKIDRGVEDLIDQPPGHGAVAYYKKKEKYKKLKRIWWSGDERCMDGFHIERVLDNSMTGGGGVGISAADCVAGGVAEEAGPTDHGQLTRCLSDLVPSEDADRTAIVLAVREVEVQVRGVPHHCQVSAGYHALHPPHRTRVLLRPRRHHVVHHFHLSESRCGIRRDGGSGNLVHRRIRAAGDVLNVEVQLRHL